LSSVVWLSQMARTSVVGLEHDPVMGRPRLRIFDAEGSGSGHQF
jgi:hypothetical protein